MVPLHIEKGGDVFALLLACTIAGPPEPRLASESFTTGTDWRGVAQDSATLFTLAASFRIAGSPRTRAALRDGPFLRDWYRSVTNVGGWNDGDKFFTNYITHPLLGAVAADIYANRQVAPARFGWTRAYRNRKLREFAFAFAVSENFEFGVLSEAMIDNVGIIDGQSTWQDHVYTPVFGIAFSIAEDAIDATIVLPSLAEHRTLGRVLAIILTPIRAFANLLAFRAPWWRAPAVP